MSGLDDILGGTVKPDVTVGTGNGMAQSGLDAILKSTPQYTGADRLARIAGSNAAKGLAESVGQFGTLADLGQWTMNHLYDPAISLMNRGINYAFGSNLPTGEGLTHQFKAQMPGNPLSSASLVSGLTNAGIANRPDLTPQGNLEQMVASGSEGLGSSAPFMFGGGLLGAGRVAAQGIGGGLGAHYGQESLTGNNALTDVVGEHPIIGSLIGGGIGALGGGMAFDAPTKLVNAMRPSGAGLSDTAQAYVRQDIPMRLAGDVSDSPAAAMTQNYAAKSLGGSGVIEKGAHAELSAFNDRVHQLADTFGTQKTAEAAGQVGQDAARDWLENRFPAMQQAAWAPVDAKVGATAETPLTNYAKALNGITGQARDLIASNKALSPGKAQELLTAFLEDVGTPDVAKTGKAGVTTWAEAQNLRSKIGAAMGNPDIEHSLGTQNLARLYGALTEDMRNTAQANGAGRAFDQANVVSTEGHAFKRDILSNLVSSKNPAQGGIAPEKAAEWALRQGDTNMWRIRQEMPEFADALASYKLRDMIKANPGKAGATGAEPSTATFLTELNRMKQDTPTGMQALFNTGVSRQWLDDMATIAASQKSAARFMNHSNSGPHVAGIPGMMLGAVEGGRIGYEMYGLPGAIGGAAVGGGAIPIANYLIAKGVTNPLLMRLLAARGAPALQGAAKVGVHLAPGLAVASPYLEKLAIGQ